MHFVISNRGKIMLLRIALAVFGLTAILPKPAWAVTSSCAHETFADFLAVFTEDIAIQRRYAALPLVHEIIDDTEGHGPEPDELMLYENDIVFPVIPSRADRKRDRVSSALRSSRRGLEMELELARSDRDLRQRFLFRKKGGCWWLVRTSDDRVIR